MHRIGPSVLVTMMVVGACTGRGDGGTPIHGPSAASTCGQCMGVRRDDGTAAGGWCGATANEGRCLALTDEQSCRPIECTARWVVRAAAQDCDDAGYVSPPDCPTSTSGGAR